MKIIAAIPARYDARRFPGKLLADLCGKPVIQHTYEKVHQSGLFDRVIIVTDNNNRTVANIRSYFNKCNGNLGTSGSVEFMFDHTCNFRISPEGLDVEELELEFIDYGVDEVFVDDDGILLYASFENFGAIQKELEQRNIAILSSGFERIPTTTKSLSPEQSEEVEKLLEKIEAIRYLEMGKTIQMVETQFEGVGIDTAEDLERAKKLMS